MSSRVVDFGWTVQPAQGSVELYCKSKKGDKDYILKYKRLESMHYLTLNVKIFLMTLILIINFGYAVKKVNIKIGAGIFSFCDNSAVLHLPTSPYRGRFKYQIKHWTINALSMANITVFQNKQLGPESVLLSACDLLQRLLKNNVLKLAIS